MLKWIGSYRTMMVLLFALGLGAACATFIENDYGTRTARALVYDTLWYEVLLVLCTLNLVYVLFENKMYRKLAGFTFHFSFVIILLGAGLTRYYGFEGTMNIREGARSSSVISATQYLSIQVQTPELSFEEHLPFSLNALDNTLSRQFMIGGKPLHVKLQDFSFEKTGRITTGNIRVLVQMGIGHGLFNLKDTQANIGEAVTKVIDGAKVSLRYGSTLHTLPFELKLNKFELISYPGSKSPSEYSSELTLIDEINDTTFDAHVFMNNTFSHGGYKFFQTSYDLDEKGTILSVNKDPGKDVTYVGYALLFLGLILNFFDKNSRFCVLISRLKKLPMAFLAVILFSSLPSEGMADESYITTYVKEHAMHSYELSSTFGELVVQSRMGRMKPLDTLNKEIVYKLSGKSSLYEMTPNQIVLGMFSRPKLWKKINLIKVKTPKLRKFLGIDDTQELFKFSDFFYPSGNYKLERFVEEANAKLPAMQDTFDKDVLRVDERINIAFLVYKGSFLKIFPVQNSDKWLDFKGFWENATTVNAQEVRRKAERFLDATYNRNYDSGIPYVKAIDAYQQAMGGSVLPSKSKIIHEIWLNEAKIFPRLTLAYVLLGAALFFYAFGAIFIKYLAGAKIRMGINGVIGLLFIIHTFGMAARWYISGHAPMSDTYESIVYIAWSSVFASVVFFRRSLFALSAGVMMAGIFMFAAHLGHIDPEITNLVPVLKSFWLSVHVSVITGSYGFLGVGALLGMMSLVLFILRTEKRRYLDEHIKSITDINEVALLLGLALLVIGNFLGGIWANESWGRYWGWDPKETWAYVSIIIYVMVVHLRLLKNVYSPYLFNALSLLAFSSILMTYFGVNFYLAGMHSYATGDPVPIPTWVYYVSGAVVLLIGAAYPKRTIIKNYK